MSLDWMPFNVGDYLRDTMNLNAAEHGGYMLLICHYWERGGLPTDDDALRLISRMTPKQWARGRVKLRAFFSADWRHKRVDAELRKAAEKRKIMQNLGSIGGQARKAKSDKFSAFYQQNQGPAASARYSERYSEGYALRYSEPTKKEREPSLSSEPREASSNFTVRRGGGLDGFDPSAAMRAKLVEAANGNVSAKAAEDVSPITRLRAKGCSLEKHILPAIADLVPKLEAPLRSWADPTLVAEILKRQESGLGEGRERVPLREGDSDPVAASLERLAKGRANGAVELDVRSAPDALDSSVPDGTVLS